MPFLWFDINKVILHEVIIWRLQLFIYFLIIYILSLTHSIFFDWGTLSAKIHSFFSVEKVNCNLKLATISSMKWVHQLKKNFKNFKSDFSAHSFLRSWQMLNFCLHIQNLSFNNIFSLIKLLLIMQSKVFKGQQHEAQKEIK
jgi:hypothetical protein